MNIRRKMLQIAGLGALANAATALNIPRAAAANSDAPSIDKLNGQSDTSFVPVHTLDGWTLPYRRGLTKTERPATSGTQCIRRSP